MIRKRWLCAMAALAAGCGTADRTAREGAPRPTDSGTAAGTVERTYPKPAGEMNDIVRSAFLSLNLRLQPERHDEPEGEIRAERADGHKVFARLTEVDEDRTQVAVRSVPGDRALAEQVQRRIGEKLGAVHAK